VQEGSFGKKSPTLIHPPSKCGRCVQQIKGIMVDPLKVKAIAKLPPLHTIPQLHSLQRKANFLRRFVTNYVKITKGFMRF
jgi:hypothetical protein